MGGKTIIKNFCVVLFFVVFDVVFLVVLFLLCCVAFIVFTILVVYGVIKGKKKNGTPKQVWIGLIGLNVCNICICVYMRLCVSIDIVP